eukprot:scaffold259709_cov24-Prasinocladus_malaysianus.AAC.2
MRLRRSTASTETDVAASRPTEGRNGRDRGSPSYEWRYCRKLLHSLAGSSRERQPGLECDTGLVSLEFLLARALSRLKQARAMWSTNECDLLTRDAEAVPVTMKLFYRLSPEIVARDSIQIKLIY